MPTSFELNRQAVLGGGSTPGLSNPSTTVSGSLFEKNRQAVLTAKPSAPVFTTGPSDSSIKTESKSPQPNIFETIGSTLKSAASKVSSKIESAIPGGYQGAKERLAATPIKEYFMPTSSTPAGEGFRNYLSQTFKEGSEALKSWYKLTPAYDEIRKIQGNPITLQEKKDEILSAASNTLGFLWRVQPEAPAIGATFGSLKASRQSTQKILSGEALDPKDITYNSIVSAFDGVNNQPFLGEAVTDNPTAQLIINLGFMATMLSKPFVKSKLNTLKLKSDELAKVADVLGVKPNAPMSEIQAAYKSKIVDYKEVFAGRGTPADIARVKELNDSYNILKKTGVFQRQLSGLFGNVKLSDIKTQSAPAVEKPMAIPERIGNAPKLMSVEEARSVVINSNLENTPVGKKIIKVSIEAENTGSQVIVAKKEADIKIATPEDLKNFNRKINETNTKKVVEETLSGKREDQRLDVQNNVDIVKNYNSDIIPKDATPETTVTVSRASTEDIKPGDHVVFGETGAEKYLSSRSGSQVFTKTVPLKDLVLSNGVKSEAIYSPSTKVNPAEVSVVQPNKYYWYNNELGKFVEAEKAKPVEVHKGLDAFVHIDPNYKTWIVTEAKSGSRLGEGKTAKAAITDAKTKTENYVKGGPMPLEQVLAKAVDHSGLSPRYSSKIKPKVTPKVTKTSPKALKQTKKTEVVSKQPETSGFKPQLKSKKVIYHGTTKEALVEIKKAGFDLNKTMDGSIWFTDNLKKIKSGEVSAAGKGGIVKRIIDESKLKLGGWEETDKYSTDELIAMGYDGLKLPGDGEITYQIFNPEKLSKLKPKNTSVSSESAFNPKSFEQPESKTALGELDKVVKQSEIAKNLSEKLGIPIRIGKFRNPGALGVYKHGPKVARVKSGGLPVVFHEAAGHFLDDTYKLSQDVPAEEIEGLLSEYNTAGLAENKRSSEAFAEFMRYWLTNQDEKLADLAPQFTEIFDKRMSQLPEVKEVLDTARADYKRWQDQPATAKVLSQISIGSQNEGPLKERIVNTLHDLYTSVLDDLHPLQEFANIAEKKLGKVPAVENPYILARNLRGWTGKAELFLNKGTFGKIFWKKGENGKLTMDFKGKSYSEIMSPIEKAGLMNEFRVYLVSQRIVNDLAPRGIRTGIALSDAKSALEELEKKHPEFKIAAEERRAYKDQLLEYARDNGLIGDKALVKIRELNKYHVPFYRVMEETQQKFLGKSKFAGNMGSPIKRIKGSEREIIDPLESDVKDTYAIINAAERNNIGVAMANIAAKDFELGRLFEKVVAPMKATKVGAKEVIDKILKEVGEDEIELPEDIADMVVTLFRPTAATGPNMLNVNMGDKKLVFQVDPDLYKSIQGMNIEDVGTLLHIISMPAKLLRAGATLTPDFSVRNPFRDQFSAFVYSKHGFVPGVDMVRGMFELFKKGDVYDLWKAGGGEHAMMVSLDRAELQKQLKEVIGGKGIGIKDVVISPLKFLQIISEFGEAGTRLGEMRRALGKTDPVESAFASREITLDFARIGAKTRAMNAITAFWNANIQGTDKMIRSFKTRPFQTLFKTLVGITLPSVLLYMANRKDPRWKEIPAWQKNLFWIVMTKDHIWRIPKPFELGVLFGSAPERALEFLDQHDPKVFDDLEKTIISGFTPGFLPTGLIPIIENITNYSFFTERPIVSRGKENLPPEAQVGTYTSETARLIGQSLNYSPSKIDNLIQGYTGGLGKYAVTALDKIITGTNISSPPPPPAKEFEDLPVIKAFMIRKPVGTASESVNRVYDMYGKATAELNYVKLLVKLNDPLRAKTYIEAHPEVIQAPALNIIINSYSDMNKAIDGIRNSRNLTPQQKREKIDAVANLQTEIAQKYLSNLEKLNK